MRRFFVKRYDLAPTIQIQIFNPDNSVRDLTGATVKFFMKAAGAVNPKINAAGVIVVASQGIVGYAWANGDTNEVGEFRAEFQITQNFRPETFPAEGYILVDIEEDLGQ